MFITNITSLYFNLHKNNFFWSTLRKAVHDQPILKVLLYFLDFFPNKHSPLKLTRTVNKQQCSMYRDVPSEHPAKT